MTYIDPIYDRTLADVEYAQSHPEEMSKGAYNYTDLNRVENNTRYVADDMYNRGITAEPINLNSKYNWNEQEVPTKEDMNRIINNILLLQALSVEGLELQTIRAGGQMTYQLANAIEKNLEIMRTQPLPEPDQFYLEVENGTGSGYYTEDTVVQISADMPPENKVFDRWSGDADDLKQVGNVYAAQTTFTMWHKDAKVTANYKSGIAHKLTLNPTGIAGDGEYLEGDIVNIIAADAPNGKVFHHWEGKYTDNLMNVNASTTAFTMPDEDCELTAVYIYPGQHELTVNGGHGSGWYKYGEYVSVSASSPGSKYTFSHWSGDTQYLDDANSSYNGFEMPDEDVTVTANFNFNPGNCKLTVVNGTGSGEYKENQSVRIVANPPEDDAYEFNKWTLDGVGSISSSTSSSTYYYCGEGEAIVTATYSLKPPERPEHILTVVNRNNSGGSTQHSVREGSRYTISTNEYVGDYRFDHWEDADGTNVSTNTSYTFTMGTEDRTYTAVYTNKKIYHLTVNNGAGSGDYIENTVVNVSANAAPEGYYFYRWDGNIGNRMGSRYSPNTTYRMENSDATITATYKRKFSLTVTGGTGSGTYWEGDSVRIRANSAPTNQRFDKWTGDIDTISNVNAASTYITIPDHNISVASSYTDLPDRTLTVIKGTGSGTYKNGTTVSVVADEAPDGMTFLTWVGDIDQVENVWASTTRVVGISADATITATYFTPEHPEEYLLTVINGSYTRNYPAGSEVTIRADRPLDGYEFWKWTGDIATVRDIYSEETTMIMPAYATTVTANYREEGSIDLYTLTVNYGTGSGDYEEGTEVPIKANPPSNGYEFDKWLGDTANVMNVNSDETTFVVGKSDAVITASYRPLQKYVLTVNGGYGSGSYWEGYEVTLIANKIDDDNTHYTFQQWSGDVETVANVLEDETTMTMLPRAMEITADYLEEWHLVVAEGSGSGYYPIGQEIEISANEPPEGMKFVKWTGDTSVLESIFDETTKVTMPRSVVQVAPEYRTIGIDNSVGTYDEVLTQETDSVEISSIKMISDQLEVGTLVTDKNGNIGICTALNETTCTIKRIFIVNSKEV